MSTSLRFLQDQIKTLPTELTDAPNGTTAQCTLAAIQLSLGRAPLPRYLTHNMLTNWDDKTECTYFPLDAINNELGNRNFLDFCTQHPFCSCQHLKGVGKGFPENTFSPTTDEFLSCKKFDYIHHKMLCFRILLVDYQQLAFV